jgi:lysozyme
MVATTRIIKQIQNFEGLRLVPYKDSAGIDTIGYGHTETANQYDRITPGVANRLLLSDLSRFEKLLNNYRRGRGYVLNQNQFDALLSFVFNTGSIRFGSSLDKAIQQQDSKEVARQLLRYVNAGGQRLPGLVKRRNYEAILYMTPHYDLKTLLLVPFLL